MDGCGPLLFFHYCTALLANAAPLPCHLRRPRKRRQPYSGNTLASLIAVPKAPPLQSPLQTPSPLGVFSHHQTAVLGCPVLPSPYPYKLRTTTTLFILSSLSSSNSQTLPPLPPPPPPLLSASERLSLPPSQTFDCCNGRALEWNGADSESNPIPPFDSAPLLKLSSLPRAPRYLSPRNRPLCQSTLLWTHLTTSPDPSFDLLSLFTSSLHSLFFPSPGAVLALGRSSAIRPSTLHVNLHPSLKRPRQSPTSPIRTSRTTSTRTALLPPGLVSLSLENPPSFSTSTRSPSSLARDSGHLLEVGLDRHNGNFR